MSLRTDPVFFKYLVPDSNGNVIINKPFIQFELHILEYLFFRNLFVRGKKIKREYSHIKTYSSALRALNTYTLKKDKKLFSLVQTHIMNYSSPLSDKIIFLVHPFYIQSGLMHWIENGIPIISQQRKEDAETYRDKTLEAISRAKSNGFSVVSMSTLHHYPVLDSYLLESGCLDLVVISMYDYGIPADPSEYKKLQMFSGKEVYVGGCFNGFCPSMAVMFLRNHIKPKKIYWVPELLLNKPVQLKRTGIFKKRFLMESTLNRLVVDVVFEAKKNSFFNTFFGHPYIAIKSSENNILSLKDLFTVPLTKKRPSTLKSDSFTV